MEYIMLDLEWNAAYSKKHEKFVNEIIEIGAVRLDEALTETDRFHVLIRSRLTRRLSTRFKELTNITNEDMTGGIPFAEALRQYTAWAGQSAVTMTWSNTDLYVLLENSRSFAGKRRIPCINRYVDLQSYVQSTMRRTGEPPANQISLAAAAEALEISSEEFSLHRAEDDSRLCAALFRRTYDAEKLPRFIQDTTAADYYDRLTYKSYVITDIKSPHINRNELRFRCENCGRFAKRTGKWKFKHKQFFSAFRCSQCGNEFIGRIGFKKLYDSVVIKRQVLPMPEPVPEAENSEPV